MQEKKSKGNENVPKGGLNNRFASLCSSSSWPFRGRARKSAYIAIFISSHFLHMALYEGHPAYSAGREKAWKWSIHRTQNIKIVYQFTKGAPRRIPGNKTEGQCYALTFHEVPSQEEKTPRKDQQFCQREALHLSLHLWHKNKDEGSSEMQYLKQYKTHFPNTTCFRLNVLYINAFRPVMGENYRSPFTQFFHMASKWTILHFCLRFVSKNVPYEESRDALKEGQRIFFAHEQI